MKAYKLFSTLIPLIFVAVVFLSCSKDKSAVGSMSYGNSGNNTSGNPNSHSNGYHGIGTSRVFGTVVGLVTPVDAFPEVTIYNQFYSYGIIYTDKSGTFVIDPVPPGNYNLLVHPTNPNYSDQIIPVTVNPNEISKLAIIMQ
jgi:hypothetical protein